MSSLSNLDKGLVQKVLDLYFLYCELELPFKIGDEYEKHEYQLETAFDDNKSMWNRYEYMQEMHIPDSFKADSIKLHFYWDELAKFEIQFVLENEISSKNNLQQSKRQQFEEIEVIETKEYIQVIYKNGTRELGFKIFSYD